MVNSSEKKDLASTMQYEIFKALVKIDHSILLGKHKYGSVPLSTIHSPVQTKLKQNNQRTNGRPEQIKRNLLALLRPTHP